MKQKITTCVIYFSAAVAPLWLLSAIPNGYLVNQWALVAGSSGLLIASVIVFRWSRAGHWLGLLSGCLAIFWFYRLEFGYMFPALNTWVTFNVPDSGPGFSQELLFAKLRIATASAALMATTLSAARLLPSHWVVRKRPVQDRLWPALMLSATAILIWYLVSVSPYRIPVIVDGVTAELTLLHVEKNGNQFHETGISVFRDGQVYRFHNDRRLFQYRFAEEMGSAVLPPGSAVGKDALALREELANGTSLPVVPLRSRTAEGWYLRTDWHILAFTTENGTPPPANLLSVFHALQSVVSELKEARDEKDICFGFCYDPLAGLGIVYLNERCTAANGTHCK